MKQSIKLTAFLNTARSIMGILFPIITFPYVSRVLSVTGIGKYNFSSSVVSYFFLIATLGIDQYAVREGAKYRNNWEKINRFANQILTINIFSAGIAYILLFIALAISAKLRTYWVCILIYSIQIGFSVLSVEWLYTIYEDYIYITVRSLIFQLLSIILLFLFVRQKNDYLNYAAISVFSLVGSNILNFTRASKRFDFNLTFHFDWKKHLKPILVLFAASVATIIYINSDMTILGFLKSNYVVGIYAVSSRIYVILKNALSAMLLVAVPRLALYFGQKRMKDYRELLKQIVDSLIIITLPLMTGLFMLSKQVVLIISGPYFMRSVISLRILCFAYIFSILGAILTNCVLIPIKREKYVLASTSFSAVLNIIINILFIPLFSEKAAALSTVLAEIAMFLINYYFSRDVVKTIFISKRTAKVLLTSIIGCFSIILICRMMNYILGKSLFIGSIVTVCLSVISYFAIIFILDRSNISWLKIHLRR